jgi:NitT/TauT family transport system permease protein
VKKDFYPESDMQRNLAGSLMITVAFLGAWELASSQGWISTMFFPAPSVILKTFFQILADGRLVENSAVTLMRIGLGSILGIVPGIMVGLLMGWSRRIRDLFDPVIAALHPIPKIAIFPLILIVFGIGEQSIILVIAISAFFPALINSMTGVSQIDPVYYEVAHNYGADRWKTFQRVLLPGSLPMILSGVRLGMNTALVVAIAVELLSSGTGLGVMIWFSWQTLRVEELYAAMIAVALIGMLINFGLQAVSKWFIPWREDQSSTTTAQGR